jgi:hypothetical protein
MRTSIDLPDPLFKQVKAEATLRGMKLREFIMRCLERALAERSQTSQRLRGEAPASARRGQNTD